MLDNFHDIVDYKFTAQMEDKLDSIADGKNSLVSVLKGFYNSFASSLEKAESDAKNLSIVIPAEQTDIICDKCGSLMIVKNGRYGKFAACPNYPECKNTKPLDAPEKPTAQTPEETGLTCETCGGKLVIRNGRYGSFYACENFPRCKFTKQITKEIGVPCPKCGASVVSKRGKNNSVFFSCEKYPECDFSTWDQPSNDKCPSCGGIMMIKKGKKLTYCYNKAECGYTAKYEAENDEQ